MGYIDFEKFAEKGAKVSRENDIYFKELINHFNPTNLSKNIKKLKEEGLTNKEIQPLLDALNNTSERNEKLALLLKSGDVLAAAINKLFGKTDNT